MTSWWNGLNTRERMLIATAGILTAIVILIQFVVIPVFDAREAAMKNLERQSGYYNRVMGGLERLQSSQSSTNANTMTRSNESLEVLLSRTSQAQNIEISRLQPSGSDGKVIWFEQVMASDLHKWMYTLENDYNLNIVGFDLRKRDETAALRGSISIREGNAQ